MNNLRLTFLLLLICNSAFGQIEIEYINEPQFDLYQMDLKLLGPSFTGIQNGFAGNISHRSMFNDIEGSPVDWHFAFEAGLEILNSGFGLTYDRSTIGSYADNRIKIAYAYFFEFDKNSRLGVGTSINARVLSTDFSSLNLNNDPLLVDDDTYSNIDFDIGASYQKDRLIVGLNIVNVFESELKSDPYTSIGKNRRSLILYGQYKAEVSDSYQIMPAVMMRKFDVFTLVDLSVMNRIFDYGLVGLTYRRFFHENGYGVLYGVFGVDINRYVRILGKVYENDGSTTNLYSDTTYEIALQVNINRK